MKKMQDQSSVALSAAPSVHYEKFFEKFKEIDVIPTEQWKVNHIIGYFCARYRDTYNVDYTFRFDNKSPSKSYEVFQINKLAKMLSKQPTILKEYIDWFYKEKIILKKKRITSMAFMTDANIVNEYKFKFLMVKADASVDRTAALPGNVIAITSKFDADTKTYGQLSFINKLVDDNAIDDIYKDMIKELIKSGFDIKILDRVK